MAQIKIYGDQNKGCIFFDGSRVEPKFLGTIVASVKADEPERIVINRTDVFRRDGITFRTLFRRLKATRVQNQAGENLVSDLGMSVADVVVYINQQASNYSAGGAVRPELDEHPNFVLDATSTTIMVDNGENFGANTLKAVVGEDGLIDIVSADHSSNALTHYEDCPHGNLQINGEFIPGGAQDVANALNELFTVGPFESVVIMDPDATVVADVNGIDDAGSGVGSNVIDPAGDDVLGTTATHNNAAGYKSSYTLDQAGEYFTFDIAGKATYAFGLVHTDDGYANGDYSGNATYADPAGFCVGPNSMHYGYQWSHAFHVGNAHASWTLYGAATGYVMGPAWHNHNNEFDLKDEWNNGDPVKVKVGIDVNGFIEVATLADDGINWKLHSRSSYPVPQGVSYHLGIKPV